MIEVTQTQLLYGLVAAMIFHFFLMMQFIKLTVSKGTFALFHLLASALSIGVFFIGVTIIPQII